MRSDSPTNSQALNERGRRQRWLRWYAEARWAAEQMTDERRDRLQERFLLVSALINLDYSVYWFKEALKLPDERKSFDDFA